MKRNPSTPIVGLVQLQDGEEFLEDRKESYLYETLGGNNSRVAIQELLEEDLIQNQTSLCLLPPDNQALRSIIWRCLYPMR